MAWYIIPYFMYFITLMDNTKHENAWALTHPPASCPLCQCFCRKMSWCDITTSWCDVTWRCDVMAWRQMTSCHDRMCKDLTHQKLRKSRFSTWWPWPLTYDLDLQSHLRYYQGQSIHQIRVSKSNASAVRALTDRHTRTHTLTHRRGRFHTLDRWRGREQTTLIQCTKIRWLYMLECIISPSGLQKI